MTVLIGISVKGEPVAGVIHRPFAKSPSGEDGETLWALKGLGVRGVKNVAPRQPARATEDLKIVFTRTHFTGLIEKTAEALKPKEVLRIGGCGNKSLMVMEGKADAYVFASPGTKKWDTCAADAFVREVGGVMTDVRGEELRYDSWEEYRNKMGLVVSMHRDTQRMIVDKIPQEVKDALATAKL